MKLLGSESTYTITITEKERGFLKRLLQNPHPTWEGDEPDWVKSTREEMFTVLQLIEETENYERQT